MNKMKVILICTLLTVLIPGFSSAAAAGGETASPVKFDFGMVEKGIQWLEFINTGAAEPEVKKHFMADVAPTGGCQCIIHHWARFMEWNNELLYKFIMTAMERITSEEKLTREDGSETMFAYRRKLWKKALSNTGALKKDLEFLRSTDFTRNAIAPARQFLPPDAPLKANFFFVLFGHSTAFSVGEENGFDFLQLPRKKDGTLDIEEITRIMAHELHHTGFSYLSKKHMKVTGDSKRLQLPGIITAEGMPTYFIDQPWKHLETYRQREHKVYHMVVEDWEKHSARLPELYKQAQQDIRLNLEGKKKSKELMGFWMAGAKGPAYVLGADMMRVIDTYLGRSAALELAKDPRQLLTVYNRAAQKALEKGKKPYLFDAALAGQLARFK